MREINVKYNEGKDYRVLFNVSFSTLKGVKNNVGITKDGMLIYIERTELNIGSGYWIQDVFYEIDKEEFRDYINIARREGNIDWAIERKLVTEEELEKLLNLKS